MVEQDAYLPLIGGPLDGASLRSRHAIVAAGVVRVPANAGRYVLIDDEWFWEQDRKEGHHG